MSDYTLPAEVTEKKQQKGFVIDRHIDTAASKEAGYPVKVDYVAFRSINDQREDIYIPVREEHKANFPKEWALFEQSPEYQAFLQNGANHHSEIEKEREEIKREAEARKGLTPLTEIRGVGPALRQRLEAAGIRSVEQLAKKMPGELPNVSPTKPERLVALAKEMVDESADDVSGRGG